MIFPEQIQNIDDKRRSEPKPKPLKSTASIDKEIQSVDEVNEKARKYVNYLSKKKEVEAKRSEYTNLSEKIRLKRNEKKEIYQKTNIGVEGLEIREDGVYFNNIYSENWSDSQKIKISLELCQLLKPELNAVFIDRGESLGITTYINNSTSFAKRFLNSRPVLPNNLVSLSFLVNSFRLNGLDSL